MTKKFASFFSACSMWPYKLAEPFDKKSPAAATDCNIKNNYLKYSKC